LGAIIFAVVAFVQARRRLPTFNCPIDIGSLKIPIGGNILHKSAIARFARTLATMFAAGVPLVEAMDPWPAPLAMPFIMRLPCG
jgi:type IV pilus assembly protein PilC